VFGRRGANVQERTKNLLWRLFLLWGLGFIVVLFAGFLFDRS
jgi:hypothetical protein